MPNKIVVARFRGGLGNQMFQYACARHLASKNGCELILDTSYLTKAVQGRDYVVRSFDLDIFGLDERHATHRDLAKFFPRTRFERAHHICKRLVGKRPPQVYVEPALAFRPEVLSLEGDVLLDGYFQDERYFSDAASFIRQRYMLGSCLQEMSSGSRAIYDAVKAGNSVCLNIRRGDFVSNPTSHKFHGVCPLAYYLNAVTHMSAVVESPKVFVFSDDIEWCKVMLPSWFNATIVDHKHKGDRFSLYLFLMKSCRHFIIPNSSFGWWAAWLGEHPGKVVLCPQRWVRDVSGSSCCPPEWFRIETFLE